jgi:succinoglycan biosynthesis protein ExoM
MSVEPKPERNGDVRVDICICTYRRPELEDALLSLAAMRPLEKARIRVIVADNDDVPSARDCVYRLASRLPFEISYVHCPASNICIARNACLDLATGDFLAFVDDDETVSPDWLAELLRRAAETGAEAVLGPVRAVYAEDAPRWMKGGDFHSTLPVWVDGEIRTGYTCNLLLARSSPRLAGRRFNLDLGRTGGEDTEYLTRLHQAGGAIAFAAGALVFEKVPAVRARFPWLARRRFRMGQTHGRILSENAAGAVLASRMGIAGIKSAYCFAVAASLFFHAERRHRSILRGIMHAGVVSGLFGMREIVQYGGEPVGARGHGD